MVLKHFIDNAMTSLALLTQGGMTHQREHDKVLTTRDWFIATNRSVTVLDQGRNAELRAASLEQVLTRLA